ncbi:MAG: tetratricopeptide repeat protein [Emticicia sp.]|uniref:tetratricopeptide repeat protein n=1 Tax=Emticicia sp. TaxID=1930953 RepID=UPI003BA49356
MKNLIIATIILLILQLSAVAQDKTQKLFNEQKYGELLAHLKESKQSSNEINYWSARIAINQNKFDEATDLLEKCVETNPKEYKYHFWLGTSYARQATQGNVFQKGLLAPKIRSSFENALALSPNSIDAMKVLVEFYQQAPSMMGGSPEKAKQLATRIKQIDKVLGATTLGNLYVAEKDLQRAEAEFIEAANVEPNNFKVAFQLGNFYIRNTQYSKAISVYEQFLKTNPKSMAATYQIGKIAAISGTNLNKGEICLQSYIRTHKPIGEDPSIASAMMRLGMVYEKKNEIAEAKKYYESALKLDNSLKEAKEALAKL